MQSLLYHIERRALDFGVNLEHIFLSPPRAENLGDGWASFLYGSQSEIYYPITGDFINRLHQSSMAVEKFWDEGDRMSAITLISALPWAQSNTIQFYVNVLKENENGLTPDLQFPVQILGLMAAFWVLGNDLKPAPTRHVAGTVDEMMKSRHPETGELWAIRYFIDQTMAATKIETQKEFFDKALCHHRNCETRRREGKGYRVNKSLPSTKQCLRIVENTSNLMTDEVAAQLRSLAIIARFLQKAYTKCKEVHELYPQFDPLMPFDDIHLFEKLSLEEMLALPVVGNAST